MIPFLGEKQVSLDDKGRLAIPSALRELIPADVERLAVINGLDGCLFVYPANDITQLASRFQGIKFLSHAKARQFQRKLIRGASVEKLDGQGRIPLSNAQIEYAGLEKKSPTLVIGNFDRIEIWNPDRYEAHFEAGDDDRSLEELAEEFFAKDTEA